MVSEALELVEGAVPGSLGVAAGEVVSSRVVVNGSGVGHVPNRDQDGMFDRDDGFHPAHAGRRSAGTSPRSKCHGCSRSTTQRCPEQLSGTGYRVGLRSTSPGQRTRGCRGRCRPRADARWAAVGKTLMSAPVSATITSAVRSPIPGMEQIRSQKAAKGLDHHLDPLGQFRDGLAALVDRVEIHAGQESMMVAEPPGERCPRTTSYVVLRTT